MKNIHFIITAIALLLAFTACTNAKKETAKYDVEVLTRYVDSVESVPPVVFSKTNWVEIESGFNERISRIDAGMANLDVIEKERAEAIKAKFAAIKAGYEIKLKEAEVNLLPADEYKLTLRNNLFGEGRVGTDLNFDFVTPQNIVAVYETFIKTVVSNKDTYTSEDWDEIKALYEALDARKTVIEKDLPTADNLKIAELKVKLATIKATNRTDAKSNEEKKQ